MAHASAIDGSRCTGREVWNGHHRAGFCNKCGARDSRKLPKVPRDAADARQIARRSNGGK